MRRAPQPCWRRPRRPPRTPGPRCERRMPPLGANKTRSRSGSSGSSCSRAGTAAPPVWHSPRCGRLLVVRLAAAGVACASPCTSIRRERWCLRGTHVVSPRACRPCRRRCPPQAAILFAAQKAAERGGGDDSVAAALLTASQAAVRGALEFKSAQLLVGASWHGGVAATGVGSYSEWPVGQQCNTTELGRGPQGHWGRYAWLASSPVLCPAWCIWHARLSWTARCHTASSS